MSINVYPDLAKRVSWTLMLNDKNTRYAENTQADWCPYYAMYEGKEFKSTDLNSIKSVGIDWVKTSDLKDKINPEFVGTDCESNYKHCTTGTLVLNDGTTYYIGAVGEYSVSEKMIQIASLVADQSNLVW